MKVKLIHQEMTDIEYYGYIDKMHKKFPDIFMSVKEYKKMRAKWMNNKRI